MLAGDPVKIPGTEKRIRITEKNGIHYVQYLAERKYDKEKKHSVPTWVNIGRRIEAMPGLMIPNDRYEEIFRREGEDMDETMTAEEEQYARDNGTYGMYYPFFTGIYNEFRQLARRKADEPVNRYKAEQINKVLRPMQEMMQGEAYAEMLGLIRTTEEDEEGMNYGDVMILLTQYKSALAKYHKSRM